ARIRELRETIEASLLPDAAAVDAGTLQAELTGTTTALRSLQGEEPLVHPVVDGQAVAEVVATWTGIPVGRMVSDEIKTILNLKDRLEERVVGQPHALEAIAQAIRTNRAGLTDPRKPVGVFMMVGTSGVGKTETALAVADLLYGGEQNLTTINMSEFKEEHKVSLLMGSPPGYVGYGEGGVLTEAVRRRPYSVVLLDEMEKAHPGVQDVFYQVFDKGNMKDGEGRDIDFRNTVIIMTSNAGTDTIAKLCADPDLMPEPEALTEALRPDLLKVFKPAFLGRCNIVTYYPLADDIMTLIVGLQLNRIARRVKSAYGVQFLVDDSVPAAIVARCKEVESGARNIENILNRTMLPELSAQILARLAEGGEVGQVQVGMGEGGTFRYNIG
ncbi:MAG: AAA family ATPase, partial [Alphaproteobacteria bacterium]